VSFLSKRRPTRATSLIAMLDKAKPSPPPPVPRRRTQVREGRANAAYFVPVSYRFRLCLILVIGGASYRRSVATTTADATSHTLADHHPIGISTGVFEAARGDWPALVEQACRVSTFAVELSALSGAELPGLVRYLSARPRLPFRYVSVHAPVKHQGLEAPVLLQQLAELPVWVRSIVAHPDAISNPDAYRSLGTRLVLENMDDRKATGRTADEIEPFFEALPDASFCLDVAHAWSIDPTMTVAHELLDRLRSRLRQVHLSSLSNGHHVPVASDDESLFADVLDRCRDVPWILEARPPTRWTSQLRATGLAPAGVASDIRNA
jgi:hypothetical protein